MYWQMELNLTATGAILRICRPLQPREGSPSHWQIMLEFKSGDENVLGDDAYIHPQGTLNDEFATISMNMDIQLINF